MKVIILGSGGSAHALALACAKSDLLKTLMVAPGNAGMEPPIQCVPINLDSLDTVVQWVLKEKPDLVIISSEESIDYGLTDILRSQDIPVYGPTKSMLKLENSRLYAKNFMHQYGIYHPNFAQFGTEEEALECLRGESFPTVIKSDRPTADGSVVIAKTPQEAEDAIHVMFQGNTLGVREVIIEEFLKGEEISIMLMVSGDRYVLMPFVHVYNKLQDNDQGPTTHGMGAYAPTDLVSEELKNELVKTIIEPTLSAFKHENFDHCGTLQISIILTSKGPKVIDYKVRWSSPACQTLIPLFASDPLKAMFACAKKELDTQAVEFKNDACVSIALVPHNYPHTTSPGDKLILPTLHYPGHHLFCGDIHKDAQGHFATGEGVVSYVVCTGKTLIEAAMEAYGLSEQVQFPGRYYRKDIAIRPITRTR